MKKILGIFAGLLVAFQASAHGGHVETQGFLHGLIHFFPLLGGVVLSSIVVLIVWKKKSVGEKK